LETVPEDEERIRQLEKEELSSDSEDGDKEPETAHLVLAQFDKVRETHVNTVWWGLDIDGCMRDVKEVHTTCVDVDRILHA